MYCFKLTQFEGPLHLLLELIESEKLDITEVALAKVADDFVSHVENNPEISIDELCDFLSVAARLLMMKTRLLLPYLGALEEENEPNLANQLKIYKEYLQASDYIAAMVLREEYASQRPFLKPFFSIEFAAPDGVTSALLHKTANEIAERLLPLALPSQTIRKLLNIKDKIAHIMRLIEDCGRLPFQQMVCASYDKSEMIVTFLAILELFKRNEVHLLQGEVFGELIVLRNAEFVSK